MFDFAWSEIMLIGVVALIAIGPKDLPVAMKAVTEVIKKARRMAAEFQTHVDDMVRDVDLKEVRDQLNEIRNFDIKGTIEQAVDADHSLRDTFASNPLEPNPDPVGNPPAEPQPAAVEAAVETVPAAALPEAPSFIPPEFAAKCVPPPAFIPPGTTAPGAYYTSSFH